MKREESACAALLSCVALVIGPLVRREKGSMTMESGRRQGVVVAIECVATDIDTGLW